MRCKCGTENFGAPSLSSAAFTGGNPQHKMNTVKIAQGSQASMICRRLCVGCSSPANCGAVVAPTSSAAPVCTSADWVESNFHTSRGYHQRSNPTVAPIEHAPEMMSTSHGP